MSLRVFLPSTLGKETFASIFWFIDSPLIAYSLDLSNLICSTSLFSARFAEKILSSSNGNFFIKHMAKFHLALLINELALCVLIKKIVTNWLLIVRMDTFQAYCFLPLTSIPATLLDCSFSRLSLSPTITLFWRHFIWASRFLDLFFLEQFFLVYLIIFFCLK